MSTPPTLNDALERLRVIFSQDPALDDLLALCDTLPPEAEVAWSYAADHLPTWSLANCLEVARRAPAAVLTHHAFWTLIDEARAEHPDEVAGRLSERLAASPPHTSLAFASWNEAYRWAAHRKELWAAAEACAGGCSDDNFDDFCGWLIGQGRETYLAVINDPEHLAILPWPEGLYSAAYPNGEHMLSVTHGLVDPQLDRKHPALPEGPHWHKDRIPDYDWTDADIIRLFPRLTERFWRRSHIDLAQAAADLRDAERLAQLEHEAHHQALLSANTTAPRPYNIRERFFEGDLIDHPTFGLGVVDTVTSDRRIEVVFSDCVRKLVHER